MWRVLRAMYRVLSMVSSVSRGRGGRYFIRRAMMRGVARSTRRIRF